MSTSEYALFAKTSQASALKSLIDVLKDLLEDVCLEFDHDGVRLVSPDSTHIAMIHLKLESEKFDEYVCPQPLTVGINIIRTFKLIKSISSSDTLAFFVDDSESNNLGIRVENSDRKTSTTFEIAMMDIKGANIELPPIEFDSCISLPSTDLQKIIRDMSSIADRVEVKNLPDRLELTCTGDFCSQETVLEESSRFANKSVGAAEIIQGVFNLQYLAIFCKCSSLCPTVEINLKNDYPIVLKYSVASLGDLKLCLSPMEE